MKISSIILYNLSIAVFCFIVIIDVCSFNENEETVNHEIDPLVFLLPGT